MAERVDADRQIRLGQLARSAALEGPAETDRDRPLIVLDPDGVSVRLKPSTPLLTAWDPEKVASSRLWAPAEPA
jgi:hypothetical protein